MMDVRIEVVTPKLAKEWLSTVRHNRPVSARTVLDYATDMLAGDWPQTGDPIRFSDAGELLDGQHRLSAVIRANMAFPMVVVGGLDKGSVLYIDQCKRRSAGDSLALSDDPPENAALLAGAAGWVHRYEGHDLTGVKCHSSTQGPRLAVDTVERHPALVVACHEQANNKWTHGIIRPSMVVALYYLMGRVNAEEAREFWQRVKTGTGLTISDPEYLLRERLMRNAAAYQQNKLRPYAVAMMCIRAWNARRAGKSLGKLFGATENKVWVEIQ